MYIAHRRDDGKEQPLIEHLLHTGNKAYDFARVFGKGDLAFLCGLLHDVGKYSDEFQERIKNDGKICDHSTAGAKILVKLNQTLGKLLGYVITGHHSGLLNGGGWGTNMSEKTFYGRLKKEIPDYSYYCSEIDYSLLPQINNLVQQIANTKTSDKFYWGYTFSFIIRMIFSCLVDADFLDTEQFMNDGKVERGIECKFSFLEDKLNNHIKTFNTDTLINKKRQQILRDCLQSAENKPGVYKLTVPTGGGKTISSMAFALKHLRYNSKLRRIIYVIPFTSIIEQNAKVFSDILGDEYILEHHSNFNFDEDKDNYSNIKKLATENWDMPVIVTTNVQFFESIYGNRPSKLRKLHNIANSVVVLDEVQMLPTEYLLPCIKALEELVRNYNCTVVLCSATQPEIQRFMSKDIKTLEICSNIEELYNYFNKTQIKFIGSQRMSDLAKLIQMDNQCLIIVNTKKQAKKLFEKLKENNEGDYVYHLSTYMCPQHRSNIIKEIKERLENNEKCIVVSTSLIEAGVDIDFPVVYRAMCGLDSIIQAAGRCNRERKRECAYVYVFDFSEEEYKVNKVSAYGNYLSQRKSITEIVASKYEDVTVPAAIKEYFDILYSNFNTSELDKKGIVKRLVHGYDFTLPNDFIFDFEDIANDFKIIDNDTCTVIIKFNEEASKLIDTCMYKGFSKKDLRALQRYSINLFRYDYNKLKEINAIQEIEKDIGFLRSNEDYSLKTGIIIPEQLGIAEFL